MTGFKTSAQAENTAPNVGFAVSSGEETKTQNKNTLGVISGKIQKPFFGAFFGPAGTGKTTTAIKSPKPLIVDLENGADHYDVSRVKPRDFDGVISVIKTLSQDTQGFKTLVVDTLDVLERMIWEYVCAKNKWENIEKPGYGKGYSEALQIWDEFFDALNSLQEKQKMNVLLIGHSLIRTFQDPIKNVSYDRFSLRLNEKAAGKVRDTVDFVAFINFDTIVVGGEKGSKGKAYGGEVRKMYLQRTAGYDAKNRFGITKPLPLDWEALEAAIEKPRDIESIKSEILSLIPELKDEALRLKVGEAFTKAGENAEELDRILNKLRTICE